MPHLKELFSEASPLEGGGHADILLERDDNQQEAQPPADDPDPPAPTS